MRMRRRAMFKPDLLAVAPGHEFVGPEQIAVGAGNEKFRRRGQRGAWRVIDEALGRGERVGVSYRPI